MGSFHSAVAASRNMIFFLLLSMIFPIITGQSRYVYKPPTFKHDLRVNKMIPAERRTLMLEPDKSFRVYSVQSSEFPEFNTKSRKKFDGEILTNNINRELLGRGKHYILQSNPK